MPLVVTNTDLMFRKIFELLWFDKLHDFMLKCIWCGLKGSYDDFCLWDIYINVEYLCKIIIAAV